MEGEKGFKEEQREDKGAVLEASAKEWEGEAVLDAASSGQERAEDASSKEPDGAEDPLSKEPDGAEDASSKEPDGEALDASFKGLEEVLDPRLIQQLRFILKIDQEKEVFRQTHLTGHGRRENDAEHAWHMAVMAYLLREYANEEVDILKAVMLCLLHDLVEIEAGDTYAYDYEGKTTQAAREEAAKQKIFSLLPADQAQELMALFDEFQTFASPEAKFAHAMDNLQPLLLNNSNDGGDWREHGVSFEDVYDRQKMTRLGSERLFQLSLAVLEKHASLGNLPKKKAKIGDQKGKELEKAALQNEIHRVMEDFLAQSRLQAGQLLVVGCSTSEVLGSKIGSHPSDEVGEWIFEAIWTVLKERGIYLAAQCCEHYNRALVIPSELPNHAEQVNAIPRCHAGGSFAAAAYRGFEHPILVEHVRADGGLDIGDTLIGMHLKEVAVPLRLKEDKIGEANVTAARVRPRYIGGERAIYDENLK